MTQFLGTPVDKSLGTIDTWLDIDLSGDVPASATGAIFRVVNTSTTKSYGLRKNGSGDDRYPDLDAERQQFVIIGLDANRKCEGKIEATSIDFFLIGYTENDAVFLTNATDKSIGTTTTWTDVDLSSDIAAGSVAAIFEVVNNSISPKNYGLRKNGSTDDRHSDISGDNSNFLIVGVDANRVCEGYIESTSVDFYLLGYLTMGQAETNASDRSLGSTGSYVDIDESGNAPSGASGVFGELILAGEYKFAARKNGTSFDYYDDCQPHDSIMAGLDANRKWEGKIENVAVDFFTMGYFMPEITEKFSSDAGSGVDALGSRLLGSVDVGTVEDAVGSRDFSSMDQGEGCDVGELIATLQKSDLGAGSDKMEELIATLQKSDLGAGADAISSLVVEIIRSDSGTGVEAGLLSVYILLKLLQEKKKEVNISLLQNQRQEVNLKLSCGDAEN